MNLVVCRQSVGQGIGGVDIVGAFQGERTVQYPTIRRRIAQRIVNVNGVLIDGPIEVGLGGDAVVGDR